MIGNKLSEEAGLLTGEGKSIKLSGLRKSKAEGGDDYLGGMRFDATTQLQVTCTSGAVVPRNST